MQAKKLSGMRTVAVGAALIGAAASASTASAQTRAQRDSATAVEELIVTARKRDEVLQDIPVAASAIGSEAILDQGGLTDNQQIASLLTGVSMDQDGNPEFFIRGAGVGRVPTTDSATTQLRNGAETAGGFGGRAYSPVDLFDVAQVEVYRGPQGSLYGRNAVGGVVNVVNQPAGSTFEYRLLGESAITEEGYRLEGIVNLPLIQDRLFLRAGVQLADEEGHYYNEFLREPFQGFGGHVGRIVLRAILSEQAEATLFVDHGRSTASTLSARDIDYGRTDFTGRGVVDPIGMPVTGLRSFPLSGDSFRQAFDTRGAYTDEVTTANLNFSYQTGIGSFQSITQFRRRIFKIFNDVDGSYVGGPLRVAACGVTTATRTVTTVKCEDFRPSDTNVFTQEFRLASPDGEDFTWLVGADYRLLNNTFNILRTGRLLAPNVFLVRNSLLETEADNRQIGLFANASRTFMERLTLSAGIRYTHEVKEFDSRRTNLDPGRAAFGRLVGPPLSGELKFSSLDPSVSLTYELGNGLVYASYARAHRAGGFNQDDPSFAGIGGGFTFDSEQADSFEIGGKRTFFDRALNASIAGFIVKYKDLLYNDILQATDPRGQGSQIQFVANGGGATVKGVELDLSGRIVQVPGIGGSANLRGGLAYTDGQFTDNVRAIIQDGFEVSRTPRWNLNADLTYRRPFVGEVGLFFNTNYNWENGGVDGVAAQRPRATYTRINAQIGLEGGPEEASWRFVFYVNNIRDALTDTVRDAIGAPKTDPRSVGFRLSLRGY